ncbi:hypothetical protein [Streptomyces hawaiiensis]|uniref:hypothetical protein n=1 Tax=Streptomyces hawaiiensis TaxID=67305 RepID=UPI003653AE7D
MGDHFQTIVDLDATHADAEPLARRVVDWLVTEGIVLAERTECVLGQPVGNPPGPNWQRAVSDADDEPWDGLAVHTGRTVFDSGQDAPEAVTCPRCEATITLDAEPYDGHPSQPVEQPTTPGTEAPWARFTTALSTWQDTGSATVDCPACSRSVPLPDWTWTDGRLALGHLGFEFWNWPELTDDIRTRISGLLGGHRTAYVWGTI